MSNKYKWIIAVLLVLGIVVIAQASVSTTIYMPVFYMPSTVTPTPTATPKPGVCLDGTFHIKGIKVCFTAINQKPTSSPLDEWVDIKNTGNTVDMTGWFIISDTAPKYEFPDGFELKNGQTVRVFTKSGKNGASQLYMNRTEEFWQDNKDCGYLKNEDRKTINAFCYGTSGFTAAPINK
jgi:hypothetical protein